MPSLSAVIQRAAADPRSLTHADVLQLQRTIGNAAAGQLLRKAAPGENKTGLPDRLKSGMESLSGLAMDDVRVHYNSARPAQLQALAYTQGTDIHVAPGQEKHLPHEAWHVVQQKQGRVKPTLQMKGTAINDDTALEREADAMGARARQDRDTMFSGPAHAYHDASLPNAAVVQREPTEQEKGYFRDRVGAAYVNYRFETRPNGSETAVGLRDFYLLIRPSGKRAYWRRYKLKKSGGRGFYGRLAYNPPSMSQIGLTQSHFALLQQTPAALFTSINFRAATSIGSRDNNNKVMGEYFLWKGCLMPASVYALTADCEWLHLHGHGLGGAETPTNLYVGSHAANSHMAAVEGAVQVMHDLYGDRISIDVHILTDEDWHNEEVCEKIAAELKLDRAKVIASMGAAESRKLEFVEYSVSVSGTKLWTEMILPFTTGRFDEAQFNILNKRVREAIIRTPSTIEFVSGGFLPGSGGPPSGGDGSGATGSSSGMDMSD